MKRILFFLSLFAISFICKAQYPVTQFIGADSTLVKSRGGLQGRFAPIPFTDTTAANSSRISQYPGALIYTSGVDKYWYRNATTTGWVEFTSSGGATTNIYNSDGTLTGIRQLNGGGYPLRFNDIDEFGIGADSISITVNSPRFLISGLNTLSDTTNYKPLVMTSGGYLARSSSWFGAGGSSIDTTSLSNRINAKSDTSLVWKRGGNGGINPTTDWFGTPDSTILLAKIKGITAWRIDPNATYQRTSFGYLALDSITTGIRNTMFGYRAGASITTQGSNTGFGSGALTAAKGSVAENVAVGYNALARSQNRRNDGLGANALTWNTTGEQNNAMGNYSLMQNRNGNYNVANGSSALRGNVKGSNNSAFGVIALTQNTTSIASIDVTSGGSGYTTATVVISAPTVSADPNNNSLQATATATISGGAIVGITVTEPGKGYTDVSDGYATPVTATITGDGSGAILSVNLTSGEENTAIGGASLAYNRTGKYNTGTGYGSLASIEYGNNNVAFGYKSGYLIRGSYNAIFGNNQGDSILTKNRWLLLSDGEGNIRMTSDSSGNSRFWGNGGHRFQAGTTAQRPTNVAGTMRWNTDSSKFEYADGTTWATFGSGGGGGGTGTVTSVATNTATGITGGTITTTGTIAADTTLLSTRLWRQKGIDSVQGNITSGLSAKLNISDTATMLTPYLRKTDTTSMLTNYLRGSGTSGQFALFNGTRSIYGSSKFNFTDATYPTMSIIGSDPLIYIGPSATLTNNPAFGSGSGAAIYGGATYKSVQLVDQISGGIQMARFYNSGGTIYNNLNGLIISNTTSSPSNYQGSYTIQRTVPYSAGLNYHGFTDQTVFNAQSTAFNSFGSFVTIGNNRFTQNHYAGFQTVWYKDSTNTIGKVYDFVSAVSEVRAGTIDTLYRFKVFEATKTSGTVGLQYGIQIPELTVGTTNYGIVSMTKNGFGTYTPDSMVTTTSLHSTAGVRMENLPTGGAAADSVVVVDATGNIKKRNASAFSGSSLTIDSLTYNSSTSRLTLNVTGQSDVGVTLPNSYLVNAVNADSISKQVNDSIVKLKSVTVSANDPYLSISTTRTDTTINHAIVRTYVSEPIIAFSAGGGFAADTTVFTDSTLYGSFYTGQDSIYITSIVAVMKGQAGDTLGIRVTYNDSINVIGTHIGNATHAVNSRTTGNVITISTNQGVPPNNWIWLKSPTIIAGKKPEYLSVTLIGYRKYIAP